MSLEGRQKIIASIRESMLEHAEELARHAQRETGLGRVEHKVIKNRLVTRKTSGTEVLTPHAVTGDNGLTLTEYAPYGVIGAITPTTNPTSTIICNTIAMLSAGNSIVFNVHPNARECSMANVRLLHRAIIRGGGPANLVTAVAEPTIESAQALMTHKGVRLLAVTGGSGVVRQAMTSGKRAICAAPATHRWWSMRRPTSSTPPAASSPAPRLTTTSCAPTKRKSSPSRALSRSCCSK